MPELELSSIELFAGCGGLALGLHNAGWKGWFAIEKDPMAFETLSANLLGPEALYPSFASWPSWLPKTHHNLATLLDDRSFRSRMQKFRGRIPLVAGGPPCQGFSVGGRRDGSDDRNSLVGRMLEFVALVEPRVVLIENVEGMARRFVSKPGAGSKPVAEQVIARLAGLGYRASSHVIDASDFGVPQLRRRIVIIGFQESVCGSLSDVSSVVSDALAAGASRVKARYNLPTDRKLTAEETLHDLAGEDRVQCPDSPKFTSTPYLVAKSRYARLMRRGLRAGTIPDSHRFSVHGPRITDLYELAHATQTPGRLRKEFLLENGTKKDKKVLLDPACPVATITTHPDEYIHYLFPRNITVREMARLQSFPDDFRFKGRYTINGPRRRFDVARCSQVGNAVPPLMGEGLGYAILEALDQFERGNDQLGLPLSTAAA